MNVAQMLNPDGPSTSSAGRVETPFHKPLMSTRFPESNIRNCESEEDMNANDFFEEPQTALSSRVDGRPQWNHYSYSDQNSYATPLRFRKIERPQLESQSISNFSTPSTIDFSLGSASPHFSPNSSRTKKTYMKLPSFTRLAPAPPTTKPTPCKVAALSKKKITSRVTIAKRSKAKKDAVRPQLKESNSRAPQRVHLREGNNTRSARIMLLENDYWCGNVRTHQVFCYGCRSDITLESRTKHEYYTFEWEKHRDRNCAGIKAKLEYLFKDFASGAKARPKGLPQDDLTPIEDEYWCDHWVKKMKAAEKSNVNCISEEGEPVWMQIHKMAVEQVVPGFRRAGNGQRHKIGDKLYKPNFKF